MKQYLFTDESVTAELKSSNPTQYNVLQPEVIDEFHQEDAEVGHGNHGDGVRAERYGNDHPTVVAIWWVWYHHNLCSEVKSVSNPLFVSSSLFTRNAHNFFSNPCLLLPRLKFNIVSIRRFKRRRFYYLPH